MKNEKQPKQDLASYNASRLVNMDILTGKEFRRLRRKNKNYKNIVN